ncbi:MAG: hypothetical protein VYA17_15510, partial [Pseudomonadota bacterium]|nr:hypothetical protein [Pseudomonadota bacterium]
MISKKMRTDHIGSLLRPQSLIDAFVARGKNQIDDEALSKAQDDAIREVVAKQEALGLEIISDGEFRRLNWQVSFSSVKGWDLWEGSWRLFLQNPGHDAKNDEKPETRGADAVEVFKVPATAKLELKENFPLREYMALKAVSSQPAKAMIMGPDRVAQMCDIPNSGPSYESANLFLDDVAA